MELELCLSVSPYAGGSYGIGASDGMVKHLKMVDTDRFWSIVWTSTWIHVLEVISFSNTKQQSRNNIWQITRIR